MVTKSKVFKKGRNNFGSSVLVRYSIETLRSREPFPLTPRTSTIHVTSALLLGLQFYVYDCTARPRSRGN